MWQALSSKDQASYLQNLYMLPFENRKLVFSYVSALGSYTLLTKTAALLSVAFAVSAWTWTEVLGSFLCAVHAALFAAVLFSFRNHPWAGSLWAVVVVIVLLWGENMAVFWILAIHSLFLLLVLWRADAYSFYFVDGKRSRTVKSRRHVLMFAYFVRYLRGHKNYLANTGILWGLALVLPVFLRRRQTHSHFPWVLPSSPSIRLSVSCCPGIRPWKGLFGSCPGREKGSASLMVCSCFSVTLRRR